MYQGAKDRPKEYRAIACNFRVPTKIVSKGALAFIKWRVGDGEAIRIVVRSRGGRWIEKYERIWRLTNFRVKTLVDSHPAWREEPADYEDMAAAIAVGLDAYAQRLAISRLLRPATPAWNRPAETTKSPTPA
jgi:hypothetical protein